MDYEKYADTQIKNWYKTIIKNKKKISTIPKNTRSEKINWKITQQKQQLAETIKKIKKNLDLPDAEKSGKISKIFIKLE